MIRRAALAAAVVAMGMLAVPAARAAVVRSACDFRAVAEQVTGEQDVVTGALYGYAIFDDTGVHTLRCYVTVDGQERDSTLRAIGQVVVVTQSVVPLETYAGAPTDICTEIDGLTVSCGGAGVAHLPRTPADDLARAAWESCCGGDMVTLDPLACAVLVTLAPGVPGVVDIEPDGDTTAARVVRVWDCPS
jgi:hypothetical protein